MLTATLRLDRLDRDFRLLERREQPCRSFLKGFLEALYVSHAQLLKAAPYVIPNIDNQSIDVSIVRSTDFNQILEDRLFTPHNRMGSPPGFSLLADPAFYLQDVNNSGASFMSSSLPGCDVGIQVGNSNAAVTTTDRRMGRRIGHGRRPPDGAPVVFEQYAAGDDTEFTIYDVNWAAQLFQPATDHRCTSVKLKLWKAGAPPADLAVDLRGNRNLGAEDPLYPVPGDVNLATGTIPAAGLGGSPGALVELVWPTPVDLYAGHLYWLVAHSAGGAAGNSYKWRKQQAGTITYERAAPRFRLTTFYSAHDSANSGSTWTMRTHQFIFQEFGQSIGEFEYGGCELAGIAFADPNGSFQVRRFFWNNCGVGVDVKEAGIQVPMGGTLNSGSENPWRYPFLVARDVVAPTITVNNTEILLVTYTFQITV
jgi:hypothetical protein